MYDFATVLYVAPDDGAALVPAGGWWSLLGDLGCARATKLPRKQATITITTDRPRSTCYSRAFRGMPRLQTAGQSPCEVPKAPCAFSPRRRLVQSHPTSFLRHNWRTCPRITFSSSPAWVAHAEPARWARRVLHFPPGFRLCVRWPAVSAAGHIAVVSGLSLLWD